MKQFLFQAVVRITELLIKLSDWTYAIIAWFPLNMGQLSRMVIARIGMFLMKALDKEQVEAAESLAAPQEGGYSQQTELELLSAASKVRDHYLETGEWTPEHTMALEALSDKLLNDCGWEEDDIHNYMRRVVEAGTDLSYDVDDDTPW